MTKEPKRQTSLLSEVSDLIILSPEVAEGGWYLHVDLAVLLVPVLQQAVVVPHLPGTAALLPLLTQVQRVVQVGAVRTSQALPATFNFSEIAV